MEIIKRDGRLVEFDKEKIYTAIIKAFKEVDGEPTPDDKRKATNISNYIYSHIEELDGKISVEEIQDIVEESLMNGSRKDVAKAYILYRAERTIERDKKSTLISKVYNRIGAKAVENSNANVDENSFSGREKEASTEIGKAMALDYGGLSKEVANAHKEMLIYQHDLEKTVYGQHNCLFLDFQEIFTHGFTTRNGDVRPPSTFASACQLIAVAFQIQSQVQFGGVASSHIDTDLAPFVKKSFYKHISNGYKYIDNDGNNEDDMIEVFKSKLNTAMPSIDDPKWFDLTSRSYKYAIDMLYKECRQACEALYHNLNTLESRQGSQVPFTSINTGRDTTVEGRLVTQFLMEASLNGIGKHHLTSIFPISIFQYKNGTNAKKGDKNYDLKLLALKSMSKRIYPNFVNGDWSQGNEDPNDLDTFCATMG